MKKEEKIGFTLFTLTLVFCFIMCITTGCGHNTGSVTMGTRVNMGFDPQNSTANISYTDGLNMFDVSRENSSWDLEIDSTNGISLSDGTIKGVKRIKREIGPQITGYLADLVNKNPDMARDYIKAMKNYWAYKAGVVPEKAKEVVKDKEATEKPVTEVKPVEKKGKAVEKPPNENKPVKQNKTDMKSAVDAQIPIKAPITPLKDTKTFTPTTTMGK